ncbi:Myb-like DNA-binding domain containing protein [Trichomonas vaginalis G3]|uniref:Myb-like DNA-binding domain containing protein n=1 Tax=Trichomonas vaginalis (strain ATCC PRA-98 / G3) TaxID=412133 RepID=A2FLG7_TRIV3|nr:RNA polymerase II transcription regulator recruiting protein [Trichomonas vaginalis G3]EAX94250.1 Myb-like DNA-binding domain containing protein [Trichomonas vaginalis G3]KAI5484184.1 RNA polymerase II transcription regulator recruiting protein [Trichomonas vaginalis G3]|eukprot:XP_001307180.1 Myb-like DNA-binding domain containing protein [Trichomonas vaginalis G3]
MTFTSDDYSGDEKMSSPMADCKSKRIKFTPEEDFILEQQVAKYGARKWNTIAQALPGRTSRQCRDRYMNYLEKGLTNEPWSSEDDRLLEQLFAVYGTKWSQIAKYFAGRSSNNIKNRWYTHLQKRFKPKLRIRQNISLPTMEKKTKLPAFQIDFGESSGIDSFLCEIRRKAQHSIQAYIE